MLKEQTIKFYRPGVTDIFATASMSPDLQKQILEDFKSKGKSDYNLCIDFRDASGKKVASLDGKFQARTWKSFKKSKL